MSEDEPWEAEPLPPPYPPDLDAGSGPYAERYTRRAGELVIRFRDDARAGRTLTGS